MTTQTWWDEKWAKDVPGPLMNDTLDNIEHDDKRAPTLQEAVKEAQYVLSLYEGGGTVASEELSGQHGAEAQKGARAEIRKLHAFIKKYSQ